MSKRTQPQNWHQYFGWIAVFNDLDREHEKLKRELATRSSPSAKLNPELLQGRIDALADARDRIQRRFKPLIERYGSLSTVAARAAIDEGLSDGAYVFPDTYQRETTQ